MSRLAPTHRPRAAEQKTGGTAAGLIPLKASLSTLRAAASECRACHLWTLGTQTVFGEGPARARVMMVGEQPGDQEDKAGLPFVGPAGALLDRALVAAGIDRSSVYLTNVVKHFKWERIGRSPRRIHKKPNAAEIRACRAPDAAARERAEHELIADLRRVAAHLESNR